MFFTQLHKAFCNRHNFYIVTDYLRGSTLCDEMVVWGSRMKANCVLFIMAQFIEALTQLREAQTIHCNLKPENILIDTLRNVTISDFGMAHKFEAQEQLAKPLDQWGHSMGTIDLPITWSCCGTVVDFYSIGVVFYELLIGQQSFLQHGFIPHPVMGGVDAAFAVKPSCPLVLRPESLCPWSSLTAPWTRKVAQP
ncbi:hypothetical protein M0805_004200 [Coniferiporia weirii]|nr:hypothetical protein M0805_004200 [Coniferiporia weirii]